MKRRAAIISVLALMFSVSVSAQEADTEPLKVMSYNIRFGEGKDGTNSWQFRYLATKKMIDDQMPDVFGLQEAMAYQVLFIKEYSRSYSCVGVGREDGRKKGEHTSIFWNKKKISRLKWGTIWLSETPERPSLGWDAACFRTATWALMKDKRTGNKFYFVNTHLDHKGKKARENGLLLIMDKMSEINKKGYPVVLVGDFNMKPEDPVIIRQDGRMDNVRKMAAKTDRKCTYNGWGKNNEILDYIYCSGFSAYEEYSTITKKYDGRTFVSDHYPIFARVVF